MLLEFSNGTQKEITDHFYQFDVVLSRSGDFLGEHVTGTVLGTSPISSGDYPILTLSRDNPIDVDIVPNVSDNFLRWYYDRTFTEQSTYVDIFWFKIHGDANVHVWGYGAPI